MSSQTATVLPFPQPRAPFSGASARPHVRLEATRRGRRLITVVAFLLGLLVAAIALLVLEVPSALAGAEPEQQVSVTVEPGDTLWGYAAQHAPEGMETQEYISQVRALNHLPTGRVTAGQQIELPIADPAQR